MSTVDKHRAGPPLIAAAAAVWAAGLCTAVVPAHAMPPVPLAPGDCQQWGFPGGIVTVGQGTGEQLTFTGSNAAAVSSPATWRKTNGLNDQGTVQGEVRPDGTVRIVFSDAGSTVPFDGRVNPDGSVTGTRPGGDTPVPWDARITCVTQAPKAGPTISFDPVIGGLVAHITDRSGVTSQCEYRSDFYTRTFRLEANSTFDLRIVPAIPEFRDRPVDITCDNGTETHTSTFF